MMRYFRWFILLSILISLRAAAQPTRAMPPPRWQAALYKPPVYYPEYVQCRPAGSTLIFAHEFKIVALDRATGRELWRRSDMTEKEADANGPVPKPLAPPGPGNLADYAGAIVRIYWQLFGTGNAEPGGPVVILFESQTHIVPDNTRPNKQRTASESKDEVAIQAVTGKELWRRPIDHDYNFMTIMGNLLIDYQGYPEEAQPIRLRYRSLATGEPLDLNGQSAQAAVQREAQRQGKGLLLAQSFSDLYSLDLNTATGTHLYRGNHYLLSYAQFVPDGRIAIHNYLDDDGAGHSVWPRYVDGTDLKGKQIWRFPRVLQQLGMDDPKTIREPYSIEPMAPCRAVGTVLCVSYWRPGGVGKHFWYGLDVRDGHVRWKRAMDAGRPKVAELGPGVLFTTLPTETGSSLGWIDGRNGNVHWIARTPPAATLYIIGDDLLLLDFHGNVSAYSLKAVLPATVRRLLN